jgi:enamine deaminase RidA (YjgF/YER057c/UK114 family)
MAAQTTSRIIRVSSPEVPSQPRDRRTARSNGIAYVAGMIARGKDGKMVEGDEYEQAKVISPRSALGRSRGRGLSDVVKVTIFVTDIKQREKVWRARKSRRRFSDEPLVRSRHWPSRRQGGDRSHRLSRRGQAVIRLE